MLHVLLTSRYSWRLKITRRSRIILEATSSSSPRIVTLCFIVIFVIVFFFLNIFIGIAVVGSIVVDITLIVIVIIFASIMLMLMLMLMMMITTAYSLYTMTKEKFFLFLWMRRDNQSHQHVSLRRSLVEVVVRCERVGALPVGTSVFTVLCCCCCCCCWWCWLDVVDCIVVEVNDVVVDVDKLRINCCCCCCWCWLFVVTTTAEFVDVVKFALILLFVGLLFPVICDDVDDCLSAFSRRAASVRNLRT